jgi:ABC-type enterobactin transport system permease subunit
MVVAVSGAAVARLLLGWIALSFLVAPLIGRVIGGEDE